MPSLCVIFLCVSMHNLNAVKGKINFFGQTKIHQIYCFERYRGYLIFLHGCCSYNWQHNVLSNKGIHPRMSLGAASLNAGGDVPSLNLCGQCSIARSLFDAPIEGVGPEDVRPPSN